MPRKLLIRTSEFPYHVTARTNNREWFQIPMSRVWDIFCHYLSKTSKIYNLKIGLFVLMSNHFHMIAWTPDENLDEAMNYLQREVSKKIGLEAGRINHLFGGPYSWTMIDSEEYLATVYRYDYQNPLVKKLVSNVEEYEYSTLYYLVGGLKTKFEVHDRDILEICPAIPLRLDQRKIWLNEKYSDLERQAIHLATKKQVFKIPTYKKFRKAFCKDSDT